MNEIQTAPKQKLRILIGISALLTVLCFCTTIFTNFIFDFHLIYGAYWGSIPYILGPSLSLTFMLAIPLVGMLLLTVYMLFFAKKGRFTSFAPASLFAVATYFSFLFYGYFYSVVSVILDIFSGDASIGFSSIFGLISNVLYFPLALLFTISGVCVVTKKFQRPALIITGVVGLFFALIVSITNTPSIWYYLKILFDGGNFVKYATHVMSISSECSATFMLAVTTLLFGIQGGIPKAEN